MDDLFGALNKLDPLKVIGLFEKLGLTYMLKNYLSSLQSTLHNPILNTTLNATLLEEQDLEGLQLSISKSDLFDADALAKRLAAHPEPAFRRLAAHIYRQARRWEDAIQILLKESLHREALSLAAESRSRPTCESLLRHFAELENETMFAATLVSCYGHLRPDVVLELGWSRGWTNTVVPFICQSMREYQERLDRMERELEGLRINGQNHHRSEMPYTAPAPSKQVLPSIMK